MEIAVKVLALAVYNSRNARNVAFVFVPNVVKSQTAIHCPMLVELIGRTELEAEYVLMAIHKAVHAVSRSGRGRWHLLRIKQCRNHRNLSFERAKAIVEAGFTASSVHGEAQLEAPVVVVQGCLYRW